MQGAKLLRALDLTSRLTTSIACNALVLVLSCILCSTGRISKRKRACRVRPSLLFTAYIETWVTD